MSAFDQDRYQVRLGWGIDGVRGLAPADVYVVVDVLGTLTGVFDAVRDAAAQDDPPRLEALIAASGVLTEAGNDGAASLLAASSVDGGPVVLYAGLRNATATAKAVYAEQHRRAARTSIALIAAGRDGRFAVEDQLGAGSVADALTTLGIDHSAPDVAVSTESFRSLRRAVTHLITASGAGLALEEAEAKDAVVAAARVDDVDHAILFRDGMLMRV